MNKAAILCELVIVGDGSSSSASVDLSQVPFAYTGDGDLLPETVVFGRKNAPSGVKGVTPATWSFSLAGTILTVTTNDGAIIGTGPVSFYLEF